MDEQLLREYVDLLKKERRRRTVAKMGSVLKVFGKAFPKGIRHPDSLVGNRHLYHPGYRGVTRLK